MATIPPRQRRDGSTAYLAEVRIKRDGRLVHRESRTFDKRRLATDWATRRESKLGKSDTVPKRKQLAPRGPLHKILLKYRKEVSDIRPMGRSKSSHIKFLEKTNLANIAVTDIKSSDLIEHVRARRRSGAGASTVNNDLVWLRIILRYARGDVPVDLTAIDDAYEVLRTEKLVAKSKARSRRPSHSELAALSAYFREKQKRRFKYSDEGWEIAQRQNHDEDRVFPFEPKTIGAAFTRACRVLEIDNLHDSWGTLSRYTHLRPESVAIRSGKK